MLKNSQTPNTPDKWISMKPTVCIVGSPRLPEYDSRLQSHNPQLVPLFSYWAISASRAFESISIRDSSIMSAHLTRSAFEQSFAPDGPSRTGAKKVALVNYLGRGVVRK
jgi:hypothetical protein